MNIADYIKSGILEAYVLGGLTAVEKQEVEKLAEQHPEIREEIAAIEDALEIFVNSEAVEPPAELKSKILGEIMQPQVKPVVRTLSQNHTLYSKLAVAAGLALIISLGTNFYLWTKLKATRTDLAAAINEKTLYANQYKALNTSYAQTAKDLAVIKSDSVKVLNLKGTQLSPESKVKVYWNPSTSETYVDIAALPPAPKGKQYQLWALENGQPVDAGVFADTSEALQQVKNINSAQAFAITLEVKGGSPTPNLDALYAIGNLQ